MILFIYRLLQLIVFKLKYLNPQLCKFHHLAGAIFLPAEKTYLPIWHLMMEENRNDLDFFYLISIQIYSTSGVTVVINVIKYYCMYIRTPPPLFISISLQVSLHFLSNVYSHQYAITCYR